MRITLPLIGISLILVALFAPQLGHARNRSYRDYYYNEHRHHVVCAEAMDQHTLNTNQRWSIIRWKEEHDRRTMGISEWITAYHAFLAELRAEKIAYYQEISKLCTIASPRNI